MEDHVKTLIGNLTVGTQKNTVAWEQTARKSEFRTRLKNGMIQVDRWIAIDDESGMEGPECADITFLNQAGETVDRAIVNADSEPEGFRAMVALHELARRNALKIDQTLKALFREIEEKAKN